VHFLCCNLDPENTCTILDLSLFFDEIALTQQCLYLIGLHWKLIFQQESFLSLSSAAVSKIGEYEFLCLDSEATLYEACVQWAKYQIHKSRAVGHQGESSEPGDDEIRQTLGDIIHRIRFPNMDAIEFARVVGKGRVLSCEEKSELYHYILTRGEVPNDHPGRLRFDLGQRSGIFSRFSETGNSEAGWPCGGLTDSISFTTNVDIEMLGVSLYGAKIKALHDFYIDITRVNNNESFCERLTKVRGFKLPSGGDDVATRVAIYFQKSAVVKANQLHTISVAMKGPVTHFGIGGKKAVSCGSVKFRFFSSNRSTNGTSVHTGQIPQIIFRRV